MDFLVGCWHRFHGIGLVACLPQDWHSYTKVAARRLLGRIDKHRGDRLVLEPACVLHSGARTIVAHRGSPFAESSTVSYALNVAGQQDCVLPILSMGYRSEYKKLQTVR